MTFEVILLFIKKYCVSIMLNFLKVFKRLGVKQIQGVHCDMKVNAFFGEKNLFFKSKFFFSKFEEGHL